MMTHLLWQDVKHNLRPIRALPLWLLAVLLAYRTLEYHQEIGDFQDYLYFAEGALSRRTYWFFWWLPLFSGVMGGSLASERRAGVTTSILSRGVSRQTYVRAKLLSAALSSAFLTFAAILGFWAIVFTTWIPGRSTHIDERVIERPAQALFIYSPLLHDLLVAAIEMTTAAGLSLIGVLAGAIVANEYVAIAMTPIGFILWRVLTPLKVWFLNPEEYIYLRYHMDWGPHFRWLIPFAPFLYWGTFAFIIATICQRIFAKKEIV